MREVTLLDPNWLTSAIYLDLDEVHRLNPEIGHKAKVPLPDNPDVAVSYQHLLELEELKGDNYEFYPDGAKRFYTVAELLEGVRREARRGREMDAQDRPRLKAAPQPVAEPVPAPGQSENRRRDPVTLAAALVVVFIFLVWIAGGISPSSARGVYAERRRGDPYHTCYLIASRCIFGGYQPRDAQKDMARRSRQDPPLVALGRVR